ncbi:DUF4124 domain-containing protein [Variovorax paradoxus]|nr:DUF4124 domain-containing protein [Variovorax paradoxus]
MRRFLVLAILGTLGPLSSAEVIRCADAAGNVSYTDGSCPSGARPVGRVSEPPVPLPGAAEPPPRAERGGTEAARGPSQAPAGPAIIDSRAGSSSSNERTGDARRSDRGSDSEAIDYGYPPDAGTYRQPMPPRDMRPRIRNCDAAGCQDTQGNHYNRSGQLDRYQTPDGKTCRPVGTTTICR